MSNPTPRERVAANVRAEVGRRQITQAAVAEVLGKSQQTASKKLRGQVAFDVDELEALAQHFGVPVAALVGEAAVA